MIWELATPPEINQGRHVKIFQGHLDIVLSVMLTSDKWWAWLQGHTSSVISVASSPTSDYFATGSGDMYDSLTFNTRGWIPALPLNPMSSGLTPMSRRNRIAQVSCKPITESSLIKSRERLLRNRNGAAFDSATPDFLGVFIGLRMVQNFLITNSPATLSFPRRGKSTHR
ncbi:hypothetical protein F4809DRAFT_642452 [Biscogniauxia mediterranea]|nr:hypothetical protein F4809DRAFT_642452 [Biscogniauxia mediterranea]